MLRGYVDNIDRSGVAGWAFDPDNSAKAVEILVVVDSTVVDRVACDKLREDLRDAGNFGDGRHGFSYNFDAPLDLATTKHLSVVFAHDGHLLERGEKTLHTTHTTDIFNPVIVTAPGRSGTTLVMKMLSSSPEISISGDYPFEVKTFAHYAYAFNILSSPRERGTTANTNTLSLDSKCIGPNWSFALDDVSLKNNQVEPLIQHFRGTVPSTFRVAFRDLILDYYKSVAIANGLSSPRYFAEKNNDVQRYPREFIQDLFPGRRELVLIRDPRDLFVSRRQFFNSMDENASIQTIICHELSRLQQLHSDALLFVKYEDLIFNFRSEADRIGEFLGVPSAPFYGADVLEMFSVHGTAASPRESVGRWRNELNNEERTMIERSCGPFLQQFGYL